MRPGTANFSFDSSESLLRQFIDRKFIDRWTLTRSNLPFYSLSDLGIQISCLMIYSDIIVVLLFSMRVR